MNSFHYDIGDKARAGARFISLVRRELQNAYSSEKKTRKLTQQEIATKLGVNRSSINRQLIGTENLTLRSVGELLWAIGWKPVFSAERIEGDDSANEFVEPYDWNASSSETSTTTELSLEFEEENA